MALEMRDAPTDLMSNDDISVWREIPTAVISDDLNRTGTMHAAIKPVGPGMNFAGQALTAQTMVGDDGTLHYALTSAWPGSVLVVDARAHVETAVWGGVPRHPRNLLVATRSTEAGKQRLEIGAAHQFVGGKTE